MQVEVHHFFHNCDGSRVLDALAVLTSSVNKLREEIKAMSATLQTAVDALTAQVTNLVTVDASATALINGFAAQLAAAVAAAQAAGATPAQLQALTDLTTTIQTNTATLAAAVAANTPAAPGP